MLHLMHMLHHAYLFPIRGYFAHLHHHIHGNPIRGYLPRWFPIRGY